MHPVEVGMLQAIIDLILDESKWLFASLVVSAIAVAIRMRGLRGRGAIAGAMSLFYGLVIALMGSGHLLAVSIKLGQGTLDGSPARLYPLGFALAVPAWWMVFAAMTSSRRKLVGLNVWTGATLLVLGLHNAPLAAPAALNVAYLHHSRRPVGWLILAVAIALYLALLVGSLVFLASGQSFEQFEGM